MRIYKKRRVVVGVILRRGPDTEPDESISAQEDGTPWLQEDGTPVTQEDGNP